MPMKPFKGIKDIIGIVDESQKDLSTGFLGVNTTNVQNNYSYRQNDIILPETEQAIASQITSQLPSNNIGNDDIEIDVVELTDNNGVKITFELLDSVEYHNYKYDLITPLIEQEESSDPEEAAVFIMKEVLSEKNGEPMLEAVEDEQLMHDILYF
jgi:hypothetical protein